MRHLVLKALAVAALAAIPSLVTPAFAGSPYYASEGTPQYGSEGSSYRQAETLPDMGQTGAFAQQRRRGLYTCSRYTEQRTRLERKNCR